MATKASAVRMVDFTESAWRLRTDTYTVRLSDAASIIALSASSTTPVLSVTVPDNNFPTGFAFNVLRFGERRVTLAAGSNVTIKTTPGTTYELADINSIATLVYSGTPTGGWVLFGDLN